MPLSGHRQVRYSHQGMFVDRDCPDCRSASLKRGRQHNICWQSAIVSRLPSASGLPTKPSHPGWLMAAGLRKLLFVQRLVNEGPSLVMERHLQPFDLGSCISCLKRGLGDQALRFNALFIECMTLLVYKFRITPQTLDQGQFASTGQGDYVIIRR